MITDRQLLPLVSSLPPSARIVAVPCPVCRMAGYVGLAALVVGCPACGGAGRLRILTRHRRPS